MKELAKPTNLISDILLSLEEVYQELSILQTIKARGPDGIELLVLQACATPLTPILHHLFSLSLNTTGVVPTEWKLHSITPIFKSGDISNVKNHRPISLLCNISKVLERLVYNKVYLTIILVQFHISNLVFAKTNLHYNSYFYILMTCVFPRNKLTVFI